MKLSKNTITVLSNFASINQGIIVQPGKLLRTMNIEKSIFVKAVVPDEFPVEFAVYDLPEFLSVFGIFGDPDVEFKSDHCVIKDLLTGDEINYGYSSSNLIVNPGERNIVLKTSDKVFKVTVALLQRIDKLAATGKLKDIKIGCETIQVYNRNGTGIKANLKVPITCAEDSDDTSLKIENLKLLPLDYDVVVSNKGISQWKHQDTDFDIEYFIVLTPPEDKKEK